MHVKQTCKPAIILVFALFSDSIANNYTPSASDLSTSLLFETKRPARKQGKIFRFLHVRCSGAYTEWKNVCAYVRPRSRQRWLRV